MSTIESTATNQRNVCREITDAINYFSIYVILDSFRLTAIVQRKMWITGATVLVLSGAIQRVIGL